jgi:hypothetical protein
VPLGATLEVRVGPGQKGQQVTELLSIDASTALHEPPRPPRPERTDQRSVQAAVEEAGNRRVLCRRQRVRLHRPPGGGKDVGSEPWPRFRYPRWPSPRSQYPPHQPEPRSILAGILETGSASVLGRSHPRTARAPITAGPFNYIPALPAEEAPGNSSSGDPVDLKAVLPQIATRT